MSDTTMPAAFIGHGSPMNALEENQYTETWRNFGQSVKRPRAIVVISAHWFIHETAVTAMQWPQTIHDFYGFPQDLFAVQYPAPGAPEIAQEIADVVKPTYVGIDGDSWGLDHGTWSVLCHAFPKADIPVVQISINALRDFDYHLKLGAALAPLRETGVLIIGSGNIVHNLGGVDFSKTDSGFDWAERFDDAAKALMLDQPGDVPSLQNHRDFRLASPTPDHFIPLLYIAGLAAADGRKPKTLVDGYAYGSISMTAYGLDIAIDVKTV